MALACVLLGASGGVRWWQDHRFATKQSRVEISPFPLKELPQTFGDWQMREGSEKSLDPEVAQVAGCTDHVIRTYSNSITGVSLTILILFGPAHAIVSHRPEVCYPSAGYRMIESPLSRVIDNGKGPAAEFRSEGFAREGGQRRREEVQYSFFHGNRWSPDANRFWKDFRHYPSMLKVQVQRHVSETEKRVVNNPTEQLLALLIPEIERRVAQTQRTEKSS